MENTNAIISITIMPVCALLVSTLILFAAFLPPLLNGGTEGKGAVAGGGVKGGCVIGIIMAGLAPALSVRAGEGVRGGRIEGIVVAGLAPAMLALAMLACAGGGVRGNGVK